MTSQFGICGRRFITATLAIATFAAGPTLAQDDEEETLDNVLVTGGRDAVRKLPGAATFIDEQEIEQFDDTDITDLLTRSPGIYLRYEDGYGLRPNIGIRGAAAERSQKITIMEDGILISPAPYSAPAAYYIPNINRMSAVEIIKGPSSIRHGPHTVGGAMNLATAGIPRSRAGKVEATFGSDNYYKFRGSYGDRVGQFGFLIDFLNYGADGFKSLDGGGPTGFERNDVNLKFEWRSDASAANQQQLQVKFGYADEDSDETYLGLTDDDFSMRPDRRYVASQLDRFHSEHSQVHALYSMSLESGWEFSANAYVNRFERSWNKFDGLINGPPANLVIARPNIFTTEIALLRGEIDSSSAAGQLIDVTNNDREYGSHGGEIAAGYVLELGPSTHNLTAGIRFHHDYVERDHHQRGYEMTAGFLVFDGIDNRAKKALNEAKTNAIAAFINDEIEMGNWTFNAGVRVENIQREFDDSLNPTITTNDESVVLPGIGVLWQWNDQWALFGGVHAGFSPAAPAPGSEVDSEGSTNFEYGLRYTGDDLLIEAIGFFSDYSNLIGRCRVSDSVCQPGEEFSAGDVQIAGAEFSANYVHDFASGWSLPAGLVYTYTESAFQNSFLSGFPQWGNVVSGDELPYLPEHTARLQVGLENDRFAALVAAKYVSEMREQAGQDNLVNGLFTPAYTIVDVSATWRLNDAWLIRVVVENLTDEREIVSRRPIGARPTAPQIYKLGIQYRF